MHRTSARIALTVIVPLLVTIPAFTACAASMTALNRGLAYYGNGRYEAALNSFEDAVRVAPQDPAAWNDRGVARAKLGEYVGALGDYSKAIELAPTDPDHYFNRGNAYMALGNYDYAIQDFNRAVSLAPTYAKAFFNRGTARLRIGDRGGAEADWRYAIAVERDPAVQTAMVKSAGLGPATLTTSLQAPSAEGTVAPSEPSPSASPAATTTATTPERDARTLAVRAIARDLEGDHLGAAGDLREAAMNEKDPQRRSTMERLLRAIEGAR